MVASTRSPARTLVRAEAVAAEKPASARTSVRAGDLVDATITAN